MIGVSARPTCSGFMQITMIDGVFDKSRVEVLPFINLDPTRPSTVYMALCFARKECEKQGRLACPVTFDQPLYMKAAEIVAASPDLARVFDRLGGFHMVMSYMGSIGNIRTGIGLEELWDNVHAKNSML